ncbi:hypothetical protein IE53DRAFT_191961 [Violaceomyces palustris]|uniref:Uncharacterized protein n=1 Tax=Violaceomyces palustris TaxID=1673888 RepID=A0ACD0NRV8_9BASI|nr:hypothetical protein IE53DRAFT_191961 [Violaceomyces palustris]
MANGALIGAIIGSLVAVALIVLFILVLINKNCECDDEEVNLKVQLTGSKKKKEEEDAKKKKEEEEEEGKKIPCQARPLHCGDHRHEPPKLPPNHPPISSQKLPPSFSAGMGCVSSSYSGTMTGAQIWQAYTNAMGLSGGNPQYATIDVRTGQMCFRPAPPEDAPFLKITADGKYELIKPEQKKPAGNGGGGGGGGGGGDKKNGNKQEKKETTIFEGSIEISKFLEMVGMKQATASSTCPPASEPCTCCPLPASKHRGSSSCLPQQA